MVPRRRNGSMSSQILLLCLFPPWSIINQIPFKEGASFVFKFCRVRAALTRREDSKRRGSLSFRFFFCKNAFLHLVVQDSFLCGKE